MVNKVRHRPSSSPVEVSYNGLALAKGRAPIQAGLLARDWVTSLVDQLHDTTKCLSIPTRQLSKHFAV